MVWCERNQTYALIIIAT